MAHIILASSSPRRKELLQQLSLDFEIYSPDIDEAVLEGETVNCYVERLARAKAQVVVDLFPNAVVIAADTSLSFKGKIIGKPESKQHAFEIWSELSGQWHDVFSGLCVAGWLRWQWFQIPACTDERRYRRLQLHRWAG